MVWPSVLSLNVPKIHKTKTVKNICLQEKFILRSTVKCWVSVNRLPNNPACLQQVKLT